MFRDPWVTAFRSLMNGKFHAALTIAGLAIGFAAALLLSLYVRDELGYDGTFPADVYRVSSAVTMPGGATVVFDGTDYALAAGMKMDVPQIQAIARMMPQDWTVRHDQVEANETVYWADPQLFSVLPMRVLAGDLGAALDAPNSVVLTRAMARKYFGTDAPVGQTLRFNRTHVMRVTAVVQDLPSNTHLVAGIFASGRTPFSNLAEMDARPAGFHFDGSTYTYFRLRPGATPAAVRAALPDLVVSRLLIPKQNAFGVAVTLSVLSVRDIHFAPAGINAMKAPGSAATVGAAATVALLILAGACVNFINLATARASRRALEVGVRKAAGAGRGTLALQFIAEAVLQVGAGMAVALAVVEQLLPDFNAFLQRDIGFPYWRPDMAAVLLLVVLTVSLLAGAYPALVLSSLRPVEALRGESGHLDARWLDGGRLRRILVVVQFAILTGLMIASAVIWRQTQFAAGSAARLASRNMVLVSAPCTDGLRDGLARLPGVREVVCSQPTMISSEDTVEMMETSPTDIRSLHTLSVDAGFLEAYGLTPLAGRLFDRAHGDVAAPPPDGGPQTVRMVINETALRDLGLHDPGKAIGLRLQASAARGQRFFTIIGVVPDFPTGSVRVPVAPVAYIADPSRFGMLSARVTPGRMAEALAGIADVWMAAGQPGLPRTLPLSLYAANLYRDLWREGVLFTLATGVALAIACIGLFGMAAFLAERRTKEIGIRKAMGATTGQVAALLLRQFLTPVLWANLLAWPVVWWLMRHWLAGFAAHVPLSFWLFLAGGAVTLVVTLATVAGQGILVARRPPVAALRYE
ncbi:ABC transporter permease [Nitrospirillum iridis]|uniref:Putative ABC transport system permease protein n=1 Tax=Nitrospirillum iridis TaxID=765888 RepID=A0A7X0B3I9_9PROT|nr:ABC transporter permease [Nitrospirillum iridis]MBB6255082.1 putative ABC transport system permease protein [Nitrospirillum iridis]